MSRVRVARSLVVAAIAASRHPGVRAAIRHAPDLVSDQRKTAAFEAAKRAARKAGETTARIIPPNKHF